jgi:hypothetical protein
MTKKSVLWAAALAAVATPLLGRAFGAPLVRAGQQSNATPPQVRARLAARPHPSAAERLQVRATPLAVARPAYEASLHRALAAELDGGVTFGAGPAPAGPTHAGFTLVTTALPQRAGARPLLAIGATFDGSPTCDASPTCYGQDTCVGTDTCFAFTCASWPTCYATCYGPTCNYSTCDAPTCFWTCDISFCAICPPY